MLNLRSLVLRCLILRPLMLAVVVVLELRDGLLRNLTAKAASGGAAFGGRVGR